MPQNWKPSGLAWLQRGQTGMQEGYVGGDRRSSAARHPQTGGDAKMLSLEQARHPRAAAAASRFLPLGGIGSRPGSGEPDLTE